MTNAWIPALRNPEDVVRVPSPTSVGGARHPWRLPDGSTVNDFGLWANAWIWAGYGFVIESGLGTSPITFAGAYDADAPDQFVSVPNRYVLMPLTHQVTFEAVGTESTMEIMALASPQQDSSATITGGAAATVSNMKPGGSTSMFSGTSGTGLIYAVGAVDAAGITDPNVTGAYTYWRKQRPLTDTVASGENDRNELNWDWSAFRDGPPPPIGAMGLGGSFSIYCASQAGTGFIVTQALAFPPDIAAALFGF